MNWRTTAVLFVILLALGGYLYYDSQREEEPVEEVVVEATAVPAVNESIPLIENLTITALQTVTIQRSSDSVEASFSQDAAGNWEQTTPQAQTVLSTTLTSQLTGYLTLTSNRVLAPDDNPLAAYGLETPAYHITLSSSDQQHVLHVGNQTPTKDGYYVQSGDDARIFVVSKGSVDNLINLLDNPPLPTEP